jgi:uncharacterized membrane protein
MKTVWIPALLMMSYLHSAQTSEKNAEETITFTKNVLPLLQSHCSSCHPGVVKYDVAFEQKDKIVKKVSSLSKQMPPEYIGTRLTNNEIELIKKWVQTGAKQ